MDYAGILAGGLGVRMQGSERPKQFLRLGEGSDPILVMTLHAFLDCERIGELIVAVPVEWLEYARVLIAENIEAESVGRIHLVIGGDDRHESICNICEYIEETFGVEDGDVLVTHDAVRPFVTCRIIEDNLDALEGCDCVDTVVPATDTIVVSDDGDAVEDIPQRSRYYQGQTPQSFKIKAFLEAASQLNDEQRAQLTDACKVFILAGRPVKLVEGAYSNIKITTAHDIHVATQILREAEG